MAYTPEQNKAFEDYLIKQGKTRETATKEDAQAFLNPAPVVIPTPTTTPITDTKPLIKTNLQTGQETVVGELPTKPVEPVKPIQPEIKQEKQVVTPEVQAEKTTTITPEGKTEVIKETPKPTGITKDTNWEDTDKSLGSLEQMIEARYGTVATQNPDGTITATVGDKSYKWSIGPDGNPSKTEVQQDFTQFKANDIYGQLLVNPTIDTSKFNQIEVGKAKARIDAINRYKSYTDSQLGKALTSDLLPGTQEYNDLIADPIQRLRIETLNKLNSANGKTLDVVKVAEDKSEEILNNTKVDINGETMSIKKAMEDGYISKEEMDSIYNSKEINSKQDEWLKAKNKLDELQASYDAIETDVENELKGTGATTSLKNHLISERRESLGRDLTLAQNKANNILGVITQMKKDAGDLFAINLGQYNKQEDRAYAEEQAIKQLEQQYQYTYGDLNSENPTLQNIAIKNALTDMYTKYKDIPGMESMALKEQKVQDLMSGKTTGTPMSGSQALAQVESEIRGTERYKQMISGTPKTQDLMKMGEDSIYDPNTGKWIVKPGTTSELSNLSEIAGDNIQCGKAVNTYIQDITGSYGKMGDTLNSKISALQSIGESETPIAGGVFVSNPLNNDVGHTGIVESVNPDGSITVLEANAEGKTTGGPLERKTYTKDQTQNMKFSIAPQKQISKEAKAWVDLWNKGTMDLETIMTKIGSSKEALTLKNEVSQAISNQGGVAWRKETDPAVAKFKDFKQNLDDLIKDKDQLTNVSGIIQRGPLGIFQPFDTLGKKSQDYLGKIQNILDNKTLEDFINLKSQGATFGALSNEELRMLQASSSLLAGRAKRDDSGNIVGFDMSETALETELKKLRDLYEDKIGRMTGGISSNTQAGTLTTTGKSGNTYTFTPKTQ